MTKDVFEKNLDISKTKSQQNLGHRGRVREKFLQSLKQNLNPELQDYELLEILLFGASPRKDTKFIAKNLLQKFHNISAVINADINALKSVSDVGDAAVVQIKLVSQILQRVLKSSAQQQPILNNFQALIDYAFIACKGINYEIFRAVFLDKSYKILQDELVVFGESDHVFVSPRKIAQIALNLSASFVILIHNHPSGKAQASMADIKMTNEVVSILQKLQIKVLDHLIVCDCDQQKYFSFKESGLI